MATKMRIGDCETVEVLHASATTVVYRAVRHGVSTPLVLKFPSEEYPSKNNLERFEREYQILGLLDTERTLVSLDLVHHVNSVAIVEEYFDGVSLASYLEDQELQLFQILEIAISVAEALEDIHRCGVIHKDLNPSNILIHS